MVGLIIDRVGSCLFEKEDEIPDIMSYLCLQTGD